MDGGWEPLELDGDLESSFRPGESVQICVTLDEMKDEMIAVIGRREAARIALENETHEKHLEKIRECIARGDKEGAWRLSELNFIDKEAFMLCVEAFGIEPDDVSQMVRYDILMHTNIYASTIRRIRADAGRAETERRNAKLAAEYKRNQEVAAYDREMFEARSRPRGGGGSSSSMADSIIENERKRNQAAKERALKGANIIYYD